MTGDWTIMKSNGGAMLSGAAAEAPIQTVMSGPAGGMTATEHIARALGETNVLTLDMGGTSADVGILVGGAQRHTTEYEIEWGLPGGGAADRHQVDRRRRRLDRLGRRGRLPPRRPAERRGRSRARSATAAAAPRSTVTDANLAARPARSRTTSSPAGCGSTRRRSTDAMEALGEPIGLAPLELAASIVEIANENMASAIKMVSLERGHDPRRFSLLAFGGAGPLHAAAVARVLGIPRVIVPQHPGVFSALGLLLADIRVDKVWTQAFRSNDVDAPLVNRQFERITERALAELRQEGFAGEPEIRRAINMRYFGQNYEHEVEIERRRARRGRARAGVPPLRRAARRALRLRDRGRGDRARQLQGDRDRQARAARPLARERRDRLRALGAARLRPRVRGSSTRPSRTAPRSSRASRSPGRR